MQTIIFLGTGDQLSTFAHNLKKPIKVKPIIAGEEARKNAAQIISFYHHSRWVQDYINHCKVLQGFEEPTLSIH
jgi:hypothetical protein